MPWALPRRSTTSYSWRGGTTTTASSSTGSFRDSCCRVGPRRLGRGGPGYRFDDELPAPGRYEIGSLAMPTPGPDTNGSQFFIVSGPDGTSLPPSYSLFGKVVGGLDVVKAIESVGRPVGCAFRRGGHRVGDRHRVRLIDPVSGQAGRAPSPAWPGPVEEHRHRSHALRPPLAPGVPDEGGPFGYARHRGTGRGRCTDRWSFSPCSSSWTSPKWGTTANPVSRPSPMVRPPPRASTMGR